MFKKLVLILALMLAYAANSFASYLLIPMDTEQKNHLKAYGIAYWTLKMMLKLVGCSITVVEVL
jgi:hypothetical protein